MAFASFDPLLKDTILKDIRTQCEESAVTSP